jgi:hypothetical protein
VLTHPPLKRVRGLQDFKDTYQESSVVRRFRYSGLQECQSHINMSVVSPKWITL